MSKKESLSKKPLPFLFESQTHTDVECVTHVHVNMEIVIVTSGTLNMTIGGKEYEIPMGYGTFIPPLEPHMFNSPKPNNCHVLIFSRGLVDYFFEYVQIHSPKRHIFPVSKESLALCEKILPKINDSADCICAEAILAPLCYDIRCGCEFEARKVPFDRTAYAILEYVDAHFLEELTLDSTAHAIGVHPVTISKIFSKQLGVGFNFYLQYMRCSYAVSLIKMQNLTLSEIAYASGFGCVRSFNRSFLSIYKVTPTEYKNSFLAI